MITVDVENQEIKNSQNRLSALTKKPMQTLVKQSARRVCVNLSRTIAPFGFEESAQKMGQDAVKQDYRITTIVRDESYIDFVVGVAKTKSNIDLVLTKKDSDVQYQIQWDKVTKSAPEVRKRHNARRSNRTGRVKRGEERTTTTPATYERAIQTALKRVGLAKYAYALAARDLGGTRGIPAWVKKARGKPGAGNAVSSITKGGYQITITNNVPYASRILSKSGERSSIQRESDYLRREVEAKLTGRWKR